MSSAVIFGAFALFLVLNVPIGIAIGLAIMAYIYICGGTTIQFLAQNLFTTCDSFPLMAVPFFILAGGLMEGGGLSKRLVDVANSIIGHLTGGFAMTTVLTCLFFGAVSGSSPATVAAIGSIMIPAMVAQGYSKEYSTALVAASGGLGVIIPPSIPMVIYGIATGASVGTMFIGGFGPGILTGICLMAVAYFIAKKKGYQGTGIPFSIKNVFVCLGKAIWALMVPVIILGGIYGGVFTPTEAAVVAVFYALIVGLFVYKELDLKFIYKSLVDTTVMVGTVLIIVGTGTALGKVLTMEQIPTMITNGIIAFSDNKIVIFLLLNLFLLAVGCVMDTLAAILIIGPILYPVAAAFDMSIIQFGLVLILNLSIGFITPPVGVNLFVACGITGMRFEKLAKAVLPFLFSMLVSLLIITFVPAVTEWLPKLLGLM